VALGSKPPELLSLPKLLTSQIAYPLNAIVIHPFL